MQESRLNIRTTTPPDFSSLADNGYTVRQIFLGDYFDGFSASKVLKGKVVTIYVGSDNGDLYFTPQAYVDDSPIGEAATPDKAARMAEFRAMLPNTTPQTATNGAA